MVPIFHGQRLMVRTALNVALSNVAPQQLRCVTTARVNHTRDHHPESHTLTRKDAFANSETPTLHSIALEQVFD